MQRWGITILRLAVGFTFTMHGFQKLFTFGISGTAAAMGQMGLPYPFASAVLATAAEFLGGLAILIGLGTRAAAIPVAFTMLVAILGVHAKGGYFLPTGFEYAFMMFAANIALILTGSGAFAIDNSLWRNHDSDSISQRSRTRESRVA